MQTRVIVIGGGYAGAKTVEMLTPYNDIDMTLIDKNRFHYLQAETHEFIAGITTLEDVTVDLEHFCRELRRPVSYLKTAVRSIDFDRKTLQTDRGELGYDYLVIATGASTLFPKAIKGIDEHVRDIKSLKGALYYRQRFEAFLFRQYELTGEKSGGFGVVIGGAGLSGVEIIAEMAERARKMGFTKNEITFTLIEPMATVLPGMDDFLIRECEKRLDRLHVRRIHGHFISEIKEAAILLSNAQELPADIFIFTAGIAIEEPSKNTQVRLNPRGQIQIDRFMRLEGRKDVFVVGDAAEQKNNEGELLPPTSQAAKQGAKRVAENIARSIGNVRLLPNTAKIKGVVVALGGPHAAALLFGRIRLKSPLAYWLKKLIFLLHALSLRRWL
jgi:NADH dehydrogenase